LTAPDFKANADFRQDDGEEVRQREEAGVAAQAPKPSISDSRAAGRFAERDFTCDTDKDE